MAKAVTGAGTEAGRVHGHHGGRSRGHQGRRPLAAGVSRPSAATDPCAAVPAIPSRPGQALKISVCAILLAFQSGVLVSAADDDAWAEVDSFINYEYDDVDFPRADAAAMDVQPGSSVPRTGDTYAGDQHDFERGNVMSVVSSESPLSSLPASNPQTTSRRRSTSSRPVSRRVDGSVQCPQCRDHFFDDFNCARHMAGDRQRPALKCLSCQNTFQRKLWFQRHKCPSGAGSHRRRRA